MIHSNNCHCNDVGPGGKPDKIEDLPFALSGKGLQVRALGEEWKGSWGMCIWDAVLDLQCDVLHLELPVPGGCELRRCSGALHVQPVLSLTQALHKSGASVVLNSSVSWVDIYFCSPDCKLETFSQLHFLKRGNKFHVENTTLYLILGFFFVVIWFVFFLEGTSSLSSCPALWYRNCFLRERYGNYIVCVSWGARPGVDSWVLSNSVDSMIVCNIEESASLFSVKFLWPFCTIFYFFSRTDFSLCALFIMVQSHPVSWNTLCSFYVSVAQE